MTRPICPIHLSTFALGLLLASTILPGEPLWAAEPAKTDTSQTGAPSRKAALSPNAKQEHEALGDIGRARHAAQNRKGKELLDQIERAETALLNVKQVAPDPHVDAALQHLTTARAAAGRGDLRGAEADLALATRDVTVALAAEAGAAMPASEIVPMIGDIVYDADADRVGEVVDVVYAEDGTPAAVIIGVGPFLGAGDKNVAIAPSDVTTGADRVTIARSKDQLSQAPNSPSPDYRSAVQ
jgi:hypothetical protein